MNHSYIICWAVVFLLFTNCQSTPEKTTTMLQEQKTVPKNCQQIVIVISPDDTTIVAELHRFDRKENQWIRNAAPHPVSLGRTGLAQGKGVHLPDLLDGIEKKEGDGKSPSGIFHFGKAFGYAPPSAAKGIKMPYVTIDENTQCIEDSKSRYYNQILDNTSVEKDWESADFMRRKDDLYKWGIFVQHNTPAKAESGSCIFLHLWRGHGKPTAGCTAMTEENMLGLLQWLDPSKNPLLLQVTAKDYPVFLKKYDLPSDILGSE